MRDMGWEKKSRLYAGATSAADAAAAAAAAAACVLCAQRQSCEGC